MKITAQNALIEDATIGLNEFGLLELKLHLKYSEMKTQTFIKPLKAKTNETIYNLFQVVGVKTFKDVVGKPIRVNATYEEISDIVYFVD